MPPPPSPPTNFRKTLIGDNSVNSWQIFKIPTLISILIAWSLHLIYIKLSVTGKISCVWADSKCFVTGKKPNHFSLSILFSAIPALLSWSSELSDWGRSLTKQYCNTWSTCDDDGASSNLSSPTKNQFNIEENTWFSYQILSW